MSELKSAIEVLRDRAKWPQGFAWDYSVSCTCAKGLIARTDGREHPYSAGELSKKLGIDLGQSHRIFDQLHSRCEASLITAEVVADELELLLV